MANPTAGKQLDPAARAQLFAQMTRKHMKTLPSISAVAGDTVQFKLPKLRLGDKIRLLVEATVKATHASATSFVYSKKAPFNVLRRVAVEINNGFNPFIVSGSDLYLYNLTRSSFSGQYAPDANKRGRVQTANVASAAGASNAVQFVIDLPFTLNDRDPVGLILLQNEETVVDVSLDIADPSVLLDAGQTGYTMAYTALKVTPMVESYSIPAVPEAFPDISVLKLVKSQSEVVNATGEYTLKLPVGTTYRKLILAIEDANGVGVADSTLGNIDMIFNQSDIPFSINAEILAAINQEQFGQVLPAGVFAFDFSYQGLANYGGARDYVDTERLTEFWFKLNLPSTNCRVTAIAETVSRLKMA